MKKITGLIMVRSGSERCKDKNIRKFSNTNLLKNKVEVLKRTRGISSVVVNSDCDYMLKSAEVYGAIPIKRDPTFATSETKPSELYEEVAKTIMTDHVLSASVCYPLMNMKTYKDIVSIYNENDYSSVVTAHSISHHMWIENEDGFSPLNYVPGKQPNSQELPKILSVCWGGIVTTKEAMLSGDLVGEEPHFYEIDQKQAIDIDTEFDFEMAEFAFSERGRKMCGGKCCGGGCRREE